MAVTVEDTLGVAVRILIASELPDNDSLVCTKKFNQRVISLKEDHIPREAVKIMSGFSEEVAIAVTHPLWASNEPR